MNEIALSVGGFLGDGPAAMRVVGVGASYTGANMSALGWFVIICAGLLPAAWLAFRPRRGACASVVHHTTHRRSRFGSAFAAALGSCSPTASVRNASAGCEHQSCSGRS